MDGKDILDGDIRLEHVGREPSPVDYTFTEITFSVMEGGR